MVGVFKKMKDAQAAADACSYFCKIILQEVK